MTGKFASLSYHLRGDASNYAILYAGSESHLLRETISTLETQLPPVHFLRVSRSTIVNLKRVRRLAADGDEKYIAKLPMAKACPSLAMSVRSKND